MSVTSIPPGSALGATTSAATVRITTFTPTITATAGQLYTLSIATSAPAKKAAAQSILDKTSISPNVYDSADPIKLFIIQVCIIIALSRGLGFVLKRLRQPAVISEVIGGLILGPSIMGRVPHFTNAIFPPASIPGLTLVANVGLVLFLFLVGVEADFSVFKRNTKAAIAISLVGLIVPFGLGAAVSVGVYNRFINTSTVDFGIFLLFISTAMAITAFPVLARILTELKLLSNPVGVTVLAAGVGNDVVGWILLALSVALANAGSGVTAVYILLCGVGLCLLLCFVIKPLYAFLVRKSGSYEHGPTAGIMTITFFIILAAAFVTDVIGIHPIFGAFLVGLIVVPHQQGFGARLTEKLEELVTILFIPIYFALSGLKTDLGLLNNGSIWGWVVCVIVVAFLSKFLSCAGAAKLGGFPVRESLAIGSLMSCKGLVELIVLNVGLSAGILNNQVFAMFVVMALITTFATTPLTLAFYPESYWRPKLAFAAGEKETRDVSDRKRGGDASKDEAHFRHRFVVVLERLESLPSMMSFVRLLQPLATTSIQGSTMVEETESASRSDINKSMHDGSEMANKLEKVPDLSLESASQNTSASSIYIDAHRLLALSERTSDLIKASESEVTRRADSILNIFSAFANLLSIPFNTSMSIVPQEEFVETVAAHAAETNADMVVVPWAAGASLSPEDDDPAFNRLESLFGQQAVERSPQYASFVRRIFLESSSDVGLFLDGGVSASSPLCIKGAHDIFLPFHGGPDDRAALDFIMQLVANNPQTKATISRIVKVAPSIDDQETIGNKRNSSILVGPTSPLHHHLNQLTLGAGLGNQDTLYHGGNSTQHRLASDTADNLALARYFPNIMLENSDTSIQPLLAHIASRVTFETVETPTPLKATLDALKKLSTSSPAVLVVTGRSRHSAPSHRFELESFLKDKVVAGSGLSSLGIAASSEVRKTLGDIGSSVVVSGDASSVLILQSAIQVNAFVRGKTRKNV